MSSTQVQQEKTERIKEYMQYTKKYGDVAVLLAAASALTRSPSLIDRMTYALSPEPALEAVADALRILQSDQNSQNPAITQGKDGRGYPIVSVRVDDRNVPLVIQGRLPSSESVRSFVEDVSRDVNIARKIGTYASSLLVEAQLRLEQKEGE
jgi:CRISPR type I-A-associated protein Csa5